MILRIQAPATSLEGRAQVLFDLACMEVSRHLRVLELLERVLGEVKLSPELAHEVCVEAQARRELLEEARRQRNAATYATWAARNRDRLAANSRRHRLKHRAGPASSGATGPDRT